MSNQYFQIVFHEKDAYLHVYPPTEGGACLKAAEVTQYLDFRNFKSYDVKEIGAALNSKEDTEVFVGPWDGIPVHEAMDVQFSLDKMKAICRFYPPSEGGRLKSDSEIASDLVFRKVKYGIDQEEILRFTENRQYCTDYVMARGTQPVHGRDAKIEYFFNTNRNLQPKRNEDGSVDYKDINTISHIHEGDLLARLIKEDPGTSGQTVFGDEIKPRTVKTMILEYGQNIEINEDHTELRSMVTGHVSLTNGKVFVSNVLEITGDVDNSVGNIHYDGSVTVRGNVKAGFSIVAKGDIEIDGVVENAYLESENQIIVKSGIHGMHKGVLKAGTNILARYIENAKVEAGGYVEAEIILNSEVSAKTVVRAMGKKGLINGGTVRAGGAIEAERLGTEMGTITELEVGVDPTLKERYVELKKLVEKESKSLEEKKVIVTNYGKKITAGEVLPQDKLLYVQKLALSCKQQQAELEPLRKEMSDIHVKMMESQRGYVSVQRKAHSGVVIQINDMTYNVKETVTFSKFQKVDGFIQPSPL